MSNLAQETIVAKQLVEHIRETWPDEDNTLITDMIEGETDLLRIMSWITFRIGEDEASVAANKEYQKTLGERASRLATRVERNKARLHETMDALGMKKLELDCATLSMRVGKSKVVITDEKKLPPAFFEEIITYKLNKDAVQAELAIAEMDGAHMSNAEPSLTIRRK